MNEVSVSQDEIYSGIKSASKVESRMAKDTGNVDPSMSWEAVDGLLAMPDQRPAPTRTRAAHNPERQMGVILQLEGKQQVTGAMYEPDPDAEKGKKLKARKMKSFGEPEINQIIQARMKGNKSLHLYLSEGIAESYQLGGEAFNNEAVILAPKGLEWESGKYDWVLEDAPETGFVIGGRPSYEQYVKKFVLHIIS